MPYLAEAEGWDQEQKLWFAYLNGNTQNPVTSYILIKRYPRLQDLDIEQLEEWFPQFTKGSSPSTRVGFSGSETQAHLESNLENL